LGGISPAAKLASISMLSSKLSKSRIGFSTTICYTYTINKETPCQI
jgi:hypothetical protein